jgi:hypothetical protein
VTDLVVLKMLRAAEDADLLEREWTVLEALQKSTAQGAPHFTRLLPQPRAHGVARLGMHGMDGERLTTLLQWRSGFIHTFEDVVAAHPRGAPPESSVWMWKRILELLGWVHAAGWVHGAVLPAHLIVHARDHGVVLAGWSRAVRPPARLPATSKGGQAYTPEEVWAGAPAAFTTDIAMSARCVLRVLGAEPPAWKAPPAVPAPLARLLEEHAFHRGAVEAWAVKERLDAVARDVFGPPKYIPLAMPGWN